MKHNVGKADKILRIVVGLVILAIGIYYKSWWGALAVIPFFTAFIGWCPLYLPCGISTDKSDQTSS